MAKESAVERPYVKLEAFQALMADVTMTVGGQTASAGQSVTLASAEDYLQQRIVLTLPFGTHGNELDDGVHKALEDAEISRADVAFVVLCRAKAKVKQTDIICNINLAEAPVPMEIEIPSSMASRPLSLQTPLKGSVVEVFFVLDTDRGVEYAKLNQPDRKGTWLGRTDFGVLTEDEGRGFHLEPMTDKVKETYELGGQTHWYIKFDDEPLHQEGTSIGDMVKVFVDPTLLNRMGTEKNTVDGQLIQYQLLLDVFRGLVAKALAEKESSAIQTPVKDSALYEVLAKRSGKRRPTEVEIERARARLEEDQEGFVADLSHSFNLSKVFEDALENTE